MKNLQELRSILAAVIGVAPVDSGTWLDRDQFDTILREHDVLRNGMNKPQKNMLRNSFIAKLQDMGMGDYGMKFDIKITGKGRTFTLAVVSAKVGMEGRIVALPPRMAKLMKNKTSHFEKLYKNALALARELGDTNTEMHLKFLMESHKMHNRLVLDNAVRAMEYIENMQSVYTTMVSRSSALPSPTTSPAAH